nr:hypothetical protein Iba_chr13bCG12680 [Ipomoea batatas]
MKQKEEAAGSQRWTVHLHSSSSRSRPSAANCRNWISEDSGRPLKQRSRRKSRQPASVVSPHRTTADASVHQPTETPMAVSSQANSKSHSREPKPQLQTTAYFWTRNGEGGHTGHHPYVAVNFVTSPPIQVVK